MSLILCKKFTSKLYANGVIMRLIHLCLVGFLLLLNCSSQNSEQIVKLKPIPLDSIYTENDFLHFHARPIKNNKFKEEIKKFPRGFKVQAVYQLSDLQRSYKLAKYTLSDSLGKKRYLKEFGPDKLKFLELVKKFSPYDCIVSSCIVKDDNGNEFFVFDVNNDEDFTNDPILKFQKKIEIKGQDTLQISRVNANVNIEYFNGSKVTTKTIGLIFERKSNKFGIREYWRFASLPFGTVNLNGKRYHLILNHVTPNFDFFKFDFICIDLNHNAKYEFLNNDYYQQMYLPFTIDKTVYKITEIDPWGNYIKIKKCTRQEIPPIAVGLPAPDFTATTLDSSQINLHDYLGHYVLLGFWSCNSQYCLSQIGELLGYTNKGLRIINFTFSNNFEQPLSEENRKKIKNLTIVDGDVLNPVRRLYQIGSENASILIDKQGKIVLIEKYTYNKINQKLKEIFNK